MDHFPFTEEELHIAAVSVRSAMLDSLPHPNDCVHTFSSEFEKKMNRLLRQQKSRELHRQAFRRVAAIFLAVLIGASAWLAVDTDARAAFVRWVRETYEDMTVYWFREDPVLDSLPIYRPTVVPDGWQEVSAVGDDTIQAVLYVDAENKDEYGMIFSYYLLEASRNWQIIYTGTVTDVEVNGCPGEFYYTETPGETNTLLWFDEDQGIGFSLSAFLSLSDTMHIAESISLCNLTN